MNRPIIASFLCASISLTMVSPSTYANPNSPENACIQSLIESAENHTSFSGVDFSNLTKINGPEGSQIESGTFSVTSHDEFLTVSDIPVPLIDADLPAYPDDLSRVSPDYAVQQGIHKTNRNNGAYILYGDGTSTSIGDVDGDGKDETIDGYYIDSRYVSFGQQSDLEFSYPTRDPNPQEDREFPMGAPLKDMREYLIFTHHLASKYGGDFLSCGMVKMTPTGEYALKSYSGEKSIRSTYYGLPKPKETNVKIAQKTVNGNDFKVGDIRFIVSAREIDPNGGYSFDKNLLTFNVLVSAYDNKSSFMNEYQTLQVFYDNMNDATKATSSFIESRLSFYRDLQDKLKLEILGKVATNSNDEEPEDPKKKTSFIDGRQLYASVLDANGSTSSGGGLSILPGVSLDTYEKVEAIQDETTRNMLRSALIPDYGGMLGNFTEKDEANMNDFEKSYNSYPLTYEERVENVEHILAQADDIEKLKPENFEYKDMVFGEAVIPVSDRRLRTLIEEDYISSEMAALSAKRDAEIAALQVTDAMSISQQQEMYQKQDEVERVYAAELSKLITFENQYKNFKVQFADIENQLVNGRISESEYESKRKTLFNQFNSIVKTGRLGEAIAPEKLNSLSNDLITSNQAKANEPKKITNPNEYRNDKSDLITLFIKTLAAVFFVLALGLAYLAVKKLRKKHSY